MEDVLKRIVNQLWENKKAFDVCFEDDESLQPALSRAERSRLEAIYADNVGLIKDLDKLRNILRGMK